MWNNNWIISDFDLGMYDSNPEADLRLVASERPLADLEATRHAAAANGLVRRTYQAAGGLGCVLYFLTGGQVRSKSNLLSFDFSEEAGWAARRLVRYFDYNMIDDTVIARVLDEIIAVRKDANRLEDEAIARARDMRNVTQACAS